MGRRQRSRLRTLALDVLLDSSRGRQRRGLNASRGRGSDLHGGGMQYVIPPTLIPLSLCLYLSTYYYYEAGLALASEAT